MFLKKIQKQAVQGPQPISELFQGIITYPEASLRHKTPKKHQLEQTCPANICPRNRWSGFSSNERKEKSREAREAKKNLIETGKGSSSGKAPQKGKRKASISDKLCADCKLFFAAQENRGEGEPLVGCDCCPRWFHLKCSNLDTESVKNSVEFVFFCSFCCEKEQ